MFTVYEISSETSNYIYVGLTSNLQERLYRHNGGYEKTIKPYRPFRLIYTLELLTRPEARNHEKFLKSSVGKRKLKIL
jgi:putative endonuclease